MEKRIDRLEGIVHRLAQGLLNLDAHGSTIVGLEEAGVTYCECLGLRRKWIRHGTTIWSVCESCMTRWKEFEGEWVLTGVQAEDVDAEKLAQYREIEPLVGNAPAASVVTGGDIVFGTQHDGADDPTTLREQIGDRFYEMGHRGGIEYPITAKHLLPPERR